ncbi:MAG: recF [Chlamydiia bacterium]|nr:recF [Chlamydiia bacterium]
MKLKWVYARNFRAIKNLEIECAPHINEIVGRNAQGKTSLLEAIYLVMTATSFRAASIRELIRHESEGFFVECGFEKQGVSYEVQFSFDGTKRRILLNHRPADSATLLLGGLVGVTCTPEVQNIIKGPPQLRRHFLDLMLAQMDPLYVHHLTRYNRALKQRNLLLRNKDFRTIAAWEQELALSASYITEERAKIVTRLIPWVEKFHENLSLGLSKLQLSYTTKAPLQQGLDGMRLYFEREFNRRRAQEASYGSTLVGPHRDDLEVLVENKAVRDYASEGEMRLVALTLKFAEWHVIQEQIEDHPLMLIDDFAAYLDSERLSRLFALTGNLGQAFLSMHQSNPALVSERVKTFTLEAGTLS